MVLKRRVVKARLFLKLTSLLFLERNKLYSLCEGLHIIELKSLSLKSTCAKGVTRSWKGPHHMSNLDK